MRPLEILLVAADLVVFLLLVVPLPGRAGWLRRAATITLPALGVQLLVDGPRWQLIPAYALTGLLLLVWLQSRIPAGKPREPRRCRRLAAGLGVALGVLGLAVAAALPMLLPVFRLLQRTGPHAIGTVTYHWVDAGRPEVFTADPDDRRDLMVQLWYPAKPAPAASPTPWVQDADALSAELAHLLGLPSFTFGHLQYVTSNNAIPAAPVADEQPRYPVLIFLEGSTGFRQINTFQVEELVSHGYIVAAIDQPFTAGYVVYPDGRQAAGLTREELEALVRQSYRPVETAPTMHGRAFNNGIVPCLEQDASFTLDRLAALNQTDPNCILTGRLDLQRARVFGVSLGGIVAGEACRLEPGLRACLVLDAPMPAQVVRAGFQQPAMWITRDADTMRLERRRAGGWPETDIHEHLTTMRAVFQRKRGEVMSFASFLLSVHCLPDRTHRQGSEGRIRKVHAEVAGRGSCG
jgi:predicted dienelactone hydrolase